MESELLDIRMMAAVESGNRKLVLTEALRRLNDNPEDFCGLSFVGLEYFLQGRLEDSEMCARTLAAMADPEIASTGWYLLSSCAHARDDMDEAVACVYKAFRLYPDSNEYYAWAAVYHLIRKENGLALAFANKVLQQEPEHVMCLGIQALAAYRDRGTLASEEHLDSILALEPENPIPYYYRGLLEWTRKRYERARFWIMESLELQPEFTWSHNALAMLDLEG